MRAPPLSGRYLNNPPLEPVTGDPRDRPLAVCIARCPAAFRLDARSKEHEKRASDAPPQRSGLGCEGKERARDARLDRRPRDKQPRTSLETHSQVNLCYGEDLADLALDEVKCLCALRRALQRVVQGAHSFVGFVLAAGCVSGRSSLSTLGGMGGRVWDLCPRIRNRGRLRPLEIALFPLPPQRPATCVARAPYEAGQAVAGTTSAETAMWKPRPFAAP